MCIRDRFQTIDVIFERLAIFKQALAKAGRVYDPLGVAVARGLVITRTDEERKDAIVKRIQHLEMMNAFGRSTDGKTQSSMVSDANLRKAAEDGLLIGTPDDIIARLQRMAKEGIDYVLLSTRTQESLRDFAKEVLPIFT